MIQKDQIKIKYEIVYNLCKLFHPLDKNILFYVLIFFFIEFK